MVKKVEMVGSGVDPKLAQLAKRAEKGKASIEEVRELLDSMPEVERQIGSIAEQAEWSWVSTYSEGNELVGEATRRRLESERAELMGPNPSPIERSLAHRIVLSQFQLDYVDTLMAARSREGMTASAVAMYQQWLDRAHSRYLAAVKTLALVRRLALPLVQVNMAEKQVNVAQMDVVRTATQPALELQVSDGGKEQDGA